MEPAIIEKLRVLLQKPVTTEPGVVYLLVQVRKLIEHDGDSSALETLNFYCNWIAHTTLEGTTSRNFLQPFDRAPQAIRKDIIESELGRVLALNRFQSELKTYLERKDLPAMLTDNPAGWQEFIRSFIRVVADCPLTWKKLDRDFTYLKSMTLKPSEAPEFLRLHSKAVYLAYEWHVEYQDGRTDRLPFIFGYKPAGNESIASD